MKQQRNNRRKKNPALLLILLVGVIFLIFVSTFLIKNDSTVINAAVNLNKKFELPDGTIGTLNDGSTLKYSKENWSSNSLVNLIGEAHFLVADKQELLLKTKHGNIIAQAANFNVRAWGQNLYIECYEGTLNLQVGKQAHRLQTGESINVVDGAIKEIRKIRGEEPLWLGGILRFYEVPMNDVFEELERQFDMEVMVAPDDRLFSGSFHHFNLKDALEQVCVPMKLEFSFQEGGKVVITRL